MQTLEFLALALVTVAMLSIVWGTLTLGISPMPTMPAVTRALLELVDPRHDGVIYELGAGWGTLAFALARRCPRARVIACEASPVPFLICWLRQRLAGHPNLTLRFGDLYACDLRDATLVVTYLWTGGMERLVTKFQTELQPGATVISHTFAWRGRDADETVRANDLYRTPIYRYRITP